MTLAACGAGPVSTATLVAAIPVPVPRTVRLGALARRYRTAAAELRAFPCLFVPEA